MLENRDIRNFQTQTDRIEKSLLRGYKADLEKFYPGSVPVIVELVVTDPLIYFFSF